MRIDLPWLYSVGFKRLISSKPFVMLSGHGMILEFDRKFLSWRATNTRNGDVHYVESRKDVEALINAEGVAGKSVVAN